MKPFEHHNAYSVAEAVELLNHYSGKAKVNAGGTDLLGALRDKVVSEYPEAVINIKTIDSFDYIRNNNKGLTIGALAKLADIERSPIVREEYKLLAESARCVATPQIRNMATIGGNLAQEVRCWFYRYPAHIGGPIVCLRRGGKSCSALAGDHRYHSIFGPAPLTDITSYPSTAAKGCFAVSPSDIAVALVALDASVVTTKRTLPAHLFFKATATNSTVLKTDELITEIQIPKPTTGAIQRFAKFTLRKPIDFAIVSTASILTVENGICKEARIVLGAVAPEPLRVRKAEEAIQGKVIDEKTAVEAADYALEGARPLKMNHYKLDIAKALVRQTIMG